MFRPARKYPPTLPLFCSDDYNISHHINLTAQQSSHIHSPLTAAVAGRQTRLHTRRQRHSRSLEMSPSDRTRMNDFLLLSWPLNVTETYTM